MLHKYSWFEIFQSFSFEMDESEVIPVKSTGKNYMGWSFNIKHLFKAKDYLDNLMIQH